MENVVYSEERERGRAREIKGGLSVYDLLGWEAVSKQVSERGRDEQKEMKDQERGTYAMMILARGR